MARSVQAKNSCCQTDSPDGEVRSSTTWAAIKHEEDQDQDEDRVFQDRDEPAAEERLHPQRQQFFLPCGAHPPRQAFGPPRLAAQARPRPAWSPGRPIARERRPGLALGRLVRSRRSDERATAVLRLARPAPA